jgi:hypothetical protein
MILPRFLTIRGRTSTIFSGLFLLLLASEVTCFADDSTGSGAGFQEQAREVFSETGGGKLGLAAGKALEKVDNGNLEEKETRRLVAAGLAGIMIAFIVALGLCSKNNGGGNWDAD